VTAGRHHYLILTGFAFLLGLGAMVAFRANVAAEEAAGDQGERHDQLVQIVERLEDKKQYLEESLATLRSEVSRREQQAASGRGLSRTYGQELEQMRMAAGLVALQGPGIEITLADNPQPPELGQDPNNYIIHDYDVRILVNALWLAGAEAVSVNGQRIAQGTAVRCVGTTILVNNTRIGSPFTILAIGDPVRLKNVLSLDEDARLLLEQYSKLFGLQATVDVHDEILVPAYAGSLTPRVLQPLTDEAVTVTGPGKEAP